MKTINEKKICFIICSNNDAYLNECISYLERLVVPDGYEIDLLTIGDADSLPDGYEEARSESEAKYKIYIHHDTYIVNVNILSEILNIFSADDSIAAIGMSGADNILGNRVTSASDLYGKVVTQNNREKSFSTVKNLKNDPLKEIEEKYKEVGCVSGFFIATQYDIKWPVIFNKDWIYYSAVYSLEVRKQGYKLVVPRQEEPWCIHDGNNEGLFYKKDILSAIREQYEELFDNSWLKRVLICDSEIKYDAMKVSLKRNGYWAEEFNEIITFLQYEEETIERLADWLCKNDYLCIFSYNFSSNVAEAAHRVGIKYISWAWDSPLLPYYFTEAQYDTCWKFMFDKTELEKLKNQGLSQIEYLPLATDVEYASNLHISTEDKEKYSHDISFVGKIYPKGELEDYQQKYDEKSVDILDKMLSIDICDWTDKRKMHNRVNEGIKDTFFKYNSRTTLKCYDDALFDIRIFRGIAHYERVMILNELAKRYGVDIYTNEGSDELVNVNVHGPVHNILIAPKIYHLSKINLNITTRNIITGVPLRVFDIMGVGGFVLTNYQEEISELFVEDKEIVCFRTLEELIDKAGYYLKHDKIRQEIAYNGYKRVKKDYNYDLAIKRMFEFSGVE